MNKRKVLLLGVGGMLAGAVLLAGFTANAQTGNYVDMDVMNNVVTEGIRDCRGGEGANVPLITWGGDMITIHANGDSLTTQAGSVFADEGLNVTLKREDIFIKQVEAYLRCDTPYLRGTQGQLNLAAAATEGDPRTQMITIFQHTWSNGGDALVVKGDITSPADLKGKTIALQAYGPHIGYLFKVLADAGLKPTDVILKFTKDLVGFEDDTTPGVALLEDKSIDAVMVIIPDALALTSGGNVGTGSGDSVKGARILLSTKSASRVISDVYAVRKDYYDANKAEVQSFVHGLLVAEERLVTAARGKTDAFKKTVAAAADILLDAPTALGDAEGLWLDAETTGINGNVKFFTNDKFPRNFTRITEEIQKSYVELGLLTNAVPLADAAWDYSILAMGLSNVGKIEAPRFDNAKLSAAVTAKAAVGGLDDDSLFSFQINFKPNQSAFSATVYEKSFKKVIELAATYAGAVITIEGHSDVLGYLKKKKKGAGEGILSKIRQSAKNLSIGRAVSVRDAILEMATQNGVPMDVSQFVTIGYGITQPLTGVKADGTPNAPKSKSEWLSNMRVVFNIVNIEGESESFELLD